MNMMDVCDEYNIEIKNIPDGFEHFYCPQKHTHYGVKNSEVVFIGDLKSLSHWVKDIENNLKKKVFM